MPLRYQNKVVIVTGGSRGIGRGIVKAFVENGAKVVFCAIGAAAGEALETEFSRMGPGSCKFVECDVTKEDQLERLVAVTVELHGHIDCLVNNAGWRESVPPEDRERKV
ncbi:L-fucose dehydrogenase [Xiphophorus couchianus]|uniref:L-fucose dehydrogenase n=1 Tax=Xiphophorus couchianus TaxID=32473 RepID=UPI001016DFE2|nr:17-beta-hydroxysteroid dehydrogenase 14-like [Xiphophorus couchianus]